MPFPHRTGLRPVRTSRLITAAGACGAVLATSALGAAPAQATPLASADAVGERAERAVVRRAQKHNRTSRTHVRLHRESRELRGLDPARTRGEVKDWTMKHLREANGRLRKRNARLEAAAARRLAAQRAAAARQAQTAAPAASSATTSSAGAPGNLQAIAQCESGGNPSAVGGGGAYRGLFQFSQSTWESVGGSGDPAAASASEQYARAAQLYAQQGSSPWPTCGR